MKSLIALTLVAVLASLVSCDRDTAATATGGSSSGKAQILTTFYPTQYFAERIAGDTAEVVCPVPADEDAIFWQPDAAAIARYQAADLIVLNGAGFAKWVATVSLPESKVVDTAAPFSDRFIRYDDAVTHSHGQAGEHSHTGVDGHTWVDPVNAKIQAGEIASALTERYPDNAGLYAENLAALEADLEALDATLQSYGPGPALLASHPAYNYLAERYGWNLKSLDLDPEEMPSAETLAEIEATLADFPATFILWESTPTDEIAGRLQSELGLTSITFSPVELYDGTDYLTAMRENLEQIRPAFAP